MKKVLLLILFVIVLVGCTQVVKEMPENSSGYGDSNFVSLAKGNFGGESQYYEFLIDNKPQYLEIWNEVYKNRVPIPELPKVDFNKSLVYAVFLGTKNTGGYSIEVTDVEISDKVYITLNTTEPPPGMMVTQSVTSPYHIIKIPKTGLDVTSK